MIRPSFRLTALAARCLLAAALIAGGSAAIAGMPYPHATTPAAQDAGPLALARGAAPITVTVALKLRDTDQLENLVQALHTPGSAQFRHFLSPQEFHTRFDPSAATVREAIAHFQRAGLSATLESGFMLKVTGSPQAIDAAFQVQLHAYDVAGSGRSAGYRFHAPVGEPAIASGSVAANVQAVFGLDNRPHYRPHLRKSSESSLATARVSADLRAKALPSATGGNPPGDWTVTDLAQYYNIQPLYDSGIHGEGRTLGIVTLASFTASDAFAYWNALGLATDPNRIKVVDVDGGPGAPSDDSGSDETTLDVQQSGGVAPGAKIVVYQAPNTDQGFVDAFAKAINDNTVDSLSASWGIWEWFDTQSNVTIGHGRRQQTVDVLKAYNALFLQAAVQGQSLFASSGDDGAYDANNANIAPYPSYTKTLSVDAPAASAWITAAGGTTLPGDQLYLHGTYTVKIPAERIWGWDYLVPVCALINLDPVACGIFPAGAGGGVSSYVAMPFYQYFVSGTKTTEPGQTLTDETTTPPTAVVALPSHYRGRNLPDVSLNADPETGYIVLYTSSTDGFSVYDFYGGTSFVAPQLNGIAALVGQRVRGRLGLLNVPLYAMAATPLGYTGAHAPLRDIKDGNNWFYTGKTGYEPGAGVGTLDVANFARAMLLLGY
ncbi:MAG TPA: S53 family serine peptidase [Burkholderiaceae bacterium]